jgi:hypothetical protein
MGLGCGEDLKVGLIHYIRLGFNMLVHFVAPQRSWGLL